MPDTIVFVDTEVWNGHVMAWSLVVFRVDKNGKRTMLRNINRINTDAVDNYGDTITHDKVGQQVCSVITERKRYGKITPYELHSTATNQHDFMKELESLVTRAHTAHESPVMLCGHNIGHDIRGIHNTAKEFETTSPFKDGMFVKVHPGQHVKNTKYLRNTSNPDNYNTGYKWLASVSFVDTMKLVNHSILPAFCEYYRSKHNDLYAGKGGGRECGMSQQDICRVIKQDADYSQTHGSLCDCIDLSDIVWDMVKIEGWRNVRQFTSLMPVSHSGVSATTS